MGFFASLDSDRYDRQYSDWYLAKRIFDYFSHYKPQLVTIVIAFTVLAIVTALRPVIIAHSVDLLENETDTFTLLFLALIAAAIIEYVSNWLRRLFLTRVIGQIVARLRKDAFHAAIERDLAFYDVQKTGKVVSRITSDTQEFGDVLLFSSDVISQVISVIFLVAILFTRSTALTVVLLLTTPFVFFAAMGFRSLARRVTRQGARAMAIVNDNIQESVTGISVAKNFRKEALIYSEFDRVNTLSYNINMRRGLALSTIFPALNVISGAAVGLIVYIGAQFVINGSVGAGTWFLFIQGVDRFFFPFINLSAFWSQFQAGLSAIERVFALIDAENTVVQRDHQPAGKITGKIEFKDVTFGYSDDQPVLKNFNLAIQSGESVAFVGHTGAGKSTIAKLIARFYEFQGGQICVDGRDIRTFDIPSYRRQLGIVPQEPFLFSGTILENIRYSRPDASDEEIAAIARTIGKGEWLETLPDGLYSHVGERGSRLSLGQRQLVSLLRVLIEKPAIFVLDEATASIDPFTEAQIQEAIEMLLARSTSILIAHRLSTVRSADRIIVLKEGQMIEEGNHESLIAQEGHYAELYNTYFRHQSLSYVENARALLAEAGD